MTNSTSLSVKAYETALWFSAESVAGVRFCIARVSFGGRIDLARKIREIGRKLEYLESGDMKEKLEAAVLGAEIDRAYLEWGLKGVEGLLIDGKPATPLLVIEQGPANLADEILACIKDQCGITDNERKN